MFKKNYIFIYFIVFIYIIAGELSNDDIAVYEEYLLWLKNDIKPWPKVTEYWSWTSKKRLQDFTSNKQSCHEYMDQFPAFSDPSGYLLVSI